MEQYGVVNLARARSYLENHFCYEKYSTIDVSNLKKLDYKIIKTSLNTLIVEDNKTKLLSR